MKMPSWFQSSSDKKSASERTATVFSTDRLKRWRSQDLKDSFRETLTKIEEFGWQTWAISADESGSRFAYTVGLHDTLGLPELIAVGLDPEVGGRSLNRAVALMREGVDITRGRLKDIVGEVDVEFRPVASKWLHQVMLRTDWYYEQTDVPVLQLIYPDLENKFQWDDDFNDYFRQPLLGPENAMGHDEQFFWNSHEVGSVLYKWPFPDPPHTRVFLSESVQMKEEPITYVSHDLSDGAWQFLGDKMDGGEGPVISCFHHPVEDDPTLAELHDLPLGWYATRETPTSSWERFELPPEEESENGETPLVN